MFDFLSRLVPVGELAEESKEAIDYWKEYRGETIRVERVDSFTEEYSGDRRKRRHGIEGEVSKIMSLPPGFVLVDAFEFESVQDVELTPEIPTQDFEEHDRVFVAFHSVERITFPD